MATKNPTITKSKDGLNLLKLLAQGDNDIARGRVIHQKDLFKSLEKYCEIPFSISCIFICCMF